VLKKHFLLLFLILKTVVLLNIFVEAMINFFQDYIMNRKHLFELEILINLMHLCGMKVSILF